MANKTINELTTVVVAAADEVPVWKVSAGTTGKASASSLVQSGLDADLAAIAALADPNADRLLFWDDSAGAYAHLAAGAGLSISGTTLTASGTPGGSDTQVQFNDAGAFGGDAGFVYNKTTDTLTVAGSVISTTALIARQSAGVAGTDEVQVSHNGTLGLVRNFDGDLHFASPTGIFNFNAGAGADNLTQLDALGRVNLMSIGSGTTLSVDSRANTVGIRFAGDLVPTYDCTIHRVEAGFLGIKANGSSGGCGLELGQVTAGGTPATNCARIYAKDVAGNAEVFVKDEAGTETQISPHAMDGPATFYDAADELPHVVKEVNYYTGLVRYIHHSRFIRAFQALVNGARTLAQLQALPAAERQFILVETFAEHNSRLGLTGADALVALDWQAEQQRQQDAHDAMRTQEQAERDAWEALPPGQRVGKRPDVRPARNVKKSKPAWLAARGG